VLEGRGLMDLKHDIEAAFGRVHDPCSVAAGRPKSVLDMGLVRHWHLEGRHLDVRFGVTFAGCTMAPHFMEAARAALLEIPEIESVSVSVDIDFVWHPGLMSGDPPAMIGSPQAWRGRLKSGA
jgi:metal-sulfur cluster biosynthetic enzyme